MLGSAPVEPIYDVPDDLLPVEEEEACPSKEQIGQRVLNQFDSDDDYDYYDDDAEEEGGEEYEEYDGDRNPYDHRTAVRGGVMPANDTYALPVQQRMYPDARIKSSATAPMAPAPMTLETAASHIGARATPTMEPQSIGECITQAMNEKFPEYVGYRMKHNPMEPGVHPRTLNYTYHICGTTRQFQKWASKTGGAIVLAIPPELIYQLGLMSAGAEWKAEQSRTPGPGAGKAYSLLELKTRAGDTRFKLCEAPVVTRRYSNLPYPTTCKVKGMVHPRLAGAGHTYDFIVEPSPATANYTVLKLIKKDLQRYEVRDYKLNSQLTDEVLDRLIAIADGKQDTQMHRLWINTPIGAQIKGYVERLNVAGMGNTFAGYYRGGQDPAATPLYINRMSAAKLKAELRRLRDQMTFLGNFPITLHSLRDSRKCPSTWHSKKCRAGDTPRRIMIDVTYKFVTL